MHFFSFEPRDASFTEDMFDEDDPRAGREPFDEDLDVDDERRFKDFPSPLERLTGFDEDDEDVEDEVEADDDDGFFFE